VNLHLHRPHRTTDQRLYEAIQKHGQRVPIEYVRAVLALHDLRRDVARWGR
jgi:hypothetical protein